MRRSYPFHLCMKLERLNEYILITVVILLGIAFALFAGAEVGKGQPKPIIIVLVALPLILLAIKYTSKLWVLIPLAVGFNGMITGLPLGLPLKDLVYVYVFLVFLTLKALKIVRKKQVMGVLDVILALNVIYLGFVFIRNPVGAQGLDTDKIGGRPYFDVLAACFAYWVLSTVTVSPKLAYRLPRLMIIGYLFESFAGFLADTIPVLTAPLGQFYSGFTGQTDQSENLSSADLGEARLTYLDGAGGNIPKVLSCYYNPITLMNPLFIGRFFLFFSSIGLLLLAGFRSGFFGMIVALLLAGYLRSGGRQVLKIALFPLPFLAVLVLGQGTLFELPYTAQRTLSFLPGHWDQSAVKDATNSSDWRFEMWKDALFTDIYIKNKLLGDGFGVDRKTWEAVQYAVTSHMSLRIQADACAIMGQFHSGPISTIRFVGYIGLALYYVLIIGIVQKAWILAYKAKNTLFFPLALLVSVPAILHPFIFTFIFGSFDIEFGLSIVTVGMLNLLNESLRVHSEESSQPASLAPFELERRLPNPFAPSLTTAGLNPMREKESRRKGISRV